MSLRPLITVFGATGAQGGGLARALLQGADRPFRVRAVTRRPGSAAAQALAEQGAEIVAADLDDPASVERAMQAAHGAFCVTSLREHLSPARGLAQADAMARAARRAGVRHVIWSTLEDTRDFVQADALVVGRDLPLTRLLTSFHWDQLLHVGMQPRRARDGQLDFVLPMGRGRLPGIAAADIGACVAALFRQGKAAIGRRVGIAGEHLTGAQMAAALSRVIGEPVRHVAMDPAEYAQLGFSGAAELASLFRLLHAFNDEVCALRDVAATRALYPALMRFDEFLAAHAARRPLAPRAAA